MRVLYICFIDFKTANSGNSVRPIQMYNAFKKLNFEVKLLATDYTQASKGIRKQAVNDTLMWLNEHKVDFCYIESPTTFIKFNFDFKLLKQIKKLHIPTAYFYRDPYINFKEMMFPSRGIKNFLYNLYGYYYTKKTEWYLKGMDIVYFPSDAFFKFYSYNNMKMLPPAAEPKDNVDVVNSSTCIYVGGVSPRYGTKILIEGFKKANEQRAIKLILVCRKEDLRHVDIDMNYPWLEVVHAFGDELEHYYKQASVAMIPILKTPYNEGAVPVKLFEYMSYGKAIVSTDCKVLKDFIENFKCGLTCGDTSDELAKAILDVFKDKERLTTFAKNALKCVQTNENWISRALTLKDDVLKR